MAAYPIATLADGRVKYSDGSVRGIARNSTPARVSTPARPAPRPTQNRTYAPIASSAKGPNYYLNTAGSLTYVDPNTGAVRQGIPNTPQSSDPSNYPSTQQQADQFRQSTSGQKAFDFTGFLSKLNPIRPAMASELPTSSSSLPISSSLGGTITGDPQKEDQAALFRGLNPFQSGQSFSDRIRNIVGGVAGQTGQAGLFGLPLPELGLSEFIRGTGIKKPMVGKQSYESSTPKGPQSFERPDQLSSRLVNSSRQGDADVLGLTTDVSTYNDNLKNVGTDLAQTDPNMGNDFVLLNDELESNRQDIIRGIEEGRLSEEQAAQEWERVQTEKLTDVYKKLNEMAMSRIPDIRKNAETAIQRLQGNLVKYKESATPVINNIENTFGTAIRSAVENAQKAKTNLRNVYSSMGSAESSQFLDRFGDIEKSTGQATAQLDLEKGQQIGGINTKILDEETLTNQKIADIETQTQADIKSVMDRIDLNNLEKAQAIGALVEQAQQAVLDAQRTATADRTNLNMIDREALINRQNLLTQGQIDTNSILQQSQLLNKSLASSIPQVPPEVDSVIRGFLQAPQSGGTKYFQLQALKGRYPELAELLDAVMGGQVTSQSYNTLGGSQGAGNYNFGF